MALRHDPVINTILILFMITPSKKGKSVGIFSMSDPIIYKHEKQPLIVLFFLFLFLFFQGCIVSESITPPIKMPALSDPASFGHRRICLLYKTKMDETVSNV